MKDIEKALKALANRRRLAIVRYLRSQPQATVSEIAGAIRLSLKSTSKHLAILRAADILDREQVNIQMYYSIQKPLSGILRSILHLL